MRRSGFTFIEILIVMVIIGIVAALGVPRIRDALQKQNVRSARAAVGTMVAKARATAVQRGCAATLQIRSTTAWVQSCRTNTVGGSTTLDTLGGIEQVAARWNVTMTRSNDSLRFDPRGISSTQQQVTIWFQSNLIRDSVVINRLGKVVR